MKLAWKYGVLLLSCVALHALAAENTPTDDVIKQQFARQSGGLMQMDNLKLQPISAVGNQATYTVEGDMTSTDNLYSLVGAAGDYLFYERTWTKGHPVKFSAMMTAVGTQASGWRTEFFSMQMAAKNAGRPFSGKEDLSKTLIVNDSGFMAQFAKLDAQFAQSKVTVEKQKAQQAELVKEIAKLDEQIRDSWGKDANGNPLDRSAVQQALNAQLYEVDRKNDMNRFANHYYVTVFEPALVACQKKAVCDDKPIRAASDKALEEQKQEYYRQHNLIEEKNKAVMAEKDKKVAPLLKKREELQGQMVVLDSSNYELKSDYTQWIEGVERMRKEGVIQ